MLLSRSPEKRSGFTMVELLVVIAILAILSGLTFTMFSSANKAVSHLNAKVKSVAERKYREEKKKNQPPRLEVLANRYILVYKNGLNPLAETARLAGTYAGFKQLHVYNSSLSGCSAEMDAATFQLVQKDGAIAYVERDQKVFASFQITPPGMRRIGANRSTAKVGTGRGGVPVTKPPFAPGVPRNIGTITNFRSVDVNVAVLDTGVDDTHPELNVVYSQAFGQPDTTDSTGHGTHVAGTIGAKDNSNGVVGVAPGCKIWNLRVLGAGGGSTADVIAGVDFVTQNYLTADVDSKIRVANMSLGGGYSKAMNDAVDNCVRAGVVVVVAAGNSAQDAAGFSPASADLVICVAAMGDSDGRAGGFGLPTTDGPDDTFATFSNFGAVVDFIAPGVDIESTIPMVNIPPYGLKSGTSMACPHVAGLCALIRDPDARRSHKIRNIRSIRNSPEFSPDEVRQQLTTWIQEYVVGPDARLYPLINARPF